MQPGLHGSFRDPEFAGEFGDGSTAVVGADDDLAVAEVEGGEGFFDQQPLEQAVRLVVARDVGDFSTPISWRRRALR